MQHPTHLQAVAGEQLQQERLLHSQKAAWVGAPGSREGRQRQAPGRCFQLAAAAGGRGIEEGEAVGRGQRIQQRCCH